MGHLVNPISFRLGWFSFWKSTTVVCNFSEYSYLVLSDYNLHCFFKWFLRDFYLKKGVKNLSFSRLDFYFSHVMILRTNNLVKINIFILDENLIFLINDFFKANLYNKLNIKKKLIFFRNKFNNGKRKKSLKFYLTTPVDLTKSFNLKKNLYKCFKSVRLSFISRFIYSLFLFNKIEFFQKIVNCLNKKVLSFFKSGFVSKIRKRIVKVKLLNFFNNKIYMHFYSYVYSDNFKNAFIEVYNHKLFRKKFFFYFIKSGARFFRYILRILNLFFKKIKSDTFRFDLIKKPFFGVLRCIYNYLFKKKKYFKTYFFKGKRRFRVNSIRMAKPLKIKNTIPNGILKKLKNKNKVRLKSVKNKLKFNLRFKSKKKKSKKKNKEISLSEMLDSLTRRIKNSNINKKQKFSKPFYSKFKKKRFYTKRKIDLFSFYQLYDKFNLISNGFITFNKLMGYNKKFLIKDLKIKSNRLRRYLTKYNKKKVFRSKKYSVIKVNNNKKVNSKYINDKNISKKLVNKSNKMVKKSKVLFRNRNLMTYHHEKTQKKDFSISINLKDKNNKIQQKQSNNKNLDSKSLPQEKVKSKKKTSINNKYYVNNNNNTNKKDSNRINNNNTNKKRNNRNNHRNNSRNNSNNNPNRNNNKHYINYDNNNRRNNNKHYVNYDNNRKNNNKHYINYNNNNKRNNNKRNDNKHYINYNNNNKRNNNKRNDNKHYVNYNNNNKRNNNNTNRRNKRTNKNSRFRISFNNNLNLNNKISAKFEGIKFLLYYFFLIKCFWIKIFYLLSVFFKKLFYKYNLIFNLFLIKSKFLNSNLIANYIKKNLKKKETFRYVLKQVHRDFFFNNKFFNSRILGYKIILSGRFTRKRRATYFWVHDNKTPFSTISVTVDYCFETLVLKFGICGLKIFIFKSRRTNLSLYLSLCTFRYTVY